MANQRKQKPDNKPDTLYDGQRRKTIAEAARAELKLKQELGELVPVEDVKKTAFACARRVRDAILNVPDRLAPLLAAELDAGRVHAILTKELRQALEGLSQ